MLKSLEGFAVSCCDRMPSAVLHSEHSELRLKAFEVRCQLISGYGAFRGAPVIRHLLRSELIHRADIF